MKIKRYPGKVVIDDPAWLEMDIPNHARGQLYEANWLDTQKNLSNISSSSNSWDKYSTKSDGTVSSRLGQYQTLLKEIQKDNNEDMYAVPKKIQANNSIRLKYHSDQILSKINSKGIEDNQEPLQKYFLPSQKIHREQSFKEENKPPAPRPRAKLHNIQNGEQEKFKTVLEDLQRQMKKSVRFDEVSTDIDQEIEKRDTLVEENQFRVIVNPTHELLEKISNSKDDDTAVDGRISQWVDTQNQYLTVDDTSDKIGKDLIRNDSGYYEHTKKIRQRLPPKHIYPSSSSSASSADRSDTNDNISTDADLDKEPVEEDNINDDYDNYDEVYSIYKEGASPAYVSAPLKLSKIEDKTKKCSPPPPTPPRRNDFSIPRPKLLVPVHTYAIRRRRTGNLNKRNSVSECNYDTASSTRRKEADTNNEGKCYEKCYWCRWYSI